MVGSAEIRQQLVAAMGNWFPSSLGLSFILERSSTLKANPAVLGLRWIARPAPSKLGYPGDQLGQLPRLPRPLRQRVAPGRTPPAPRLLLARALLCPPPEVAATPGQCPCWPPTPGGWPLNSPNAQSPLSSVNQLPSHVRLTDARAPQLSCKLTQAEPDLRQPHGDETASPVHRTPGHRDGRTKRPDAASPPVASGWGAACCRCSASRSRR